MSAEIKLSPHATYGALDRRVRMLRTKVSDYDRDTAEMKRKAERSGGPAARFAVDMARSPGFHKLRDRLRVAEAQLAAWKPVKKTLRDPGKFSDLVKAQLARPSYAREPRS